MLLVKFSTLSRNTSAHINTVMSPNTHQILPLVPRPRKVRTKRTKNVKKGHLQELDSYRTSPLAWASARAILKALNENASKAFTIFF
jgi:hypothetical protein